MAAGLDNYPNFKYKHNYDVNSLKTLEPLIGGKAVLIEDEPVIDDIVALNPTLPLHKARDNSMLAVGGVFIRRGVDPWIKQQLKQK
ncbi:unnamed protein product [Medioppia subpectinata]|uniref:Uncharacterized protein n=1 Tax=Medioppia subpectinata TaxID=1979941 RepID=A0A7R9KAX7_9ACAR|nr:unnamed protein product [Medioppia subpectinata]CAG2100103.1 unnamed protein product [Medioppia subpectinata]